MTKILSVTNDDKAFCVLFNNNSIICSPNEYARITSDPPIPLFPTIAADKINLVDDTLYTIKNKNTIKKIDISKPQPNTEDEYPKYILDTPLNDFAAEKIKVDGTVTTKPVLCGSDDQNKIVCGIENNNKVTLSKLVNDGQDVEGTKLAINNNLLAVVNNNTIQYGSLIIKNDSVTLDSETKLKTVPAKASNISTDGSSICYVDKITNELTCITIKDKNNKFVKDPDTYTFPKYDKKINDLSISRSHIEYAVTTELQNEDTGEVYLNESIRSGLLTDAKLISTKTSTISSCTPPFKIKADDSAGCDLICNKPFVPNDDKSGCVLKCVAPFVKKDTTDDSKGCALQCKPPFVEKIDKSGCNLVCPNDKQPNKAGTECEDMPKDVGNEFVRVQGVCRYAMSGKVGSNVENPNKRPLTKQCLNDCINDPNCVAVDGTTLDTGEQKCWLHSGKEQPLTGRDGNIYPNYSCWTKKTAVEKTGYTETDGACRDTINRGDYNTNYYGYTPQQCKKYCDSKQHCLAYTTQKGHNNCWTVEITPASITYSPGELAGKTIAHNRPTATSKITGNPAEVAWYNCFVKNKVNAPTQAELDAQVAEEKKIANQYKTTDGACRNNINRSDYNNGFYNQTDADCRKTCSDLPTCLAYTMQKGHKSCWTINVANDHNFQKTATEIRGNYGSRIISTNMITGNPAETSFICNVKNPT